MAAPFLGCGERCQCYHQCGCLNVISRPMPPTECPHSAHDQECRSITSDKTQKTAVNTNFLRWICAAGIGRLRGKGVPAMTVLAYSLAADAQGTWRIVFVPDDLHLYVEFSRPNAGSNPVHW